MDSDGTMISRIFHEDTKTFSMILDVVKLQVDYVKLEVNIEQKQASAYNRR